MTLLLVAAGALIVTLLILLAPEVGRRWRLGVLALTYWGASLMWCVDALGAVLVGEDFLHVGNAGLFWDDVLLGLLALALGAGVWGAGLVRHRRKAGL